MKAEDIIFAVNAILAYELWLSLLIRSLTYRTKLIQKRKLELRRDLKVKVKLSLCFLIEDHTLKTHCGSGDIAPCIFDLGTIWR
jgi:hypothetical protein